MIEEQRLDKNQDWLIDEKESVSLLIREEPDAKSEEINPISLGKEPNKSEYGNVPSIMKYSSTKTSSL